MIVTCLHGYFIFTEDLMGEVAFFNSFYSQNLVAKNNYYTFSKLALAPIYSVAPLPYLDVPTTKTYCGEPWEVMRENGIVYNFTLGIAQPKSAITATTPITRTKYGYRTNGIIQPGSFSPDLKKITGFQGRIDFDTQSFDYTEIFYA